MYKKITLAEAGNILGKYDQESINKFMEKIESFIPELPKENKPVLNYISEEKIGEAFCHVRNKLYIATKTTATNAEDFWKDLETSLSLLKTDYIDLYTIH